MNTDTTKNQAGTKFQQALRTATLQYQAKIAQDERNKKLCVCLMYIGDNGPCAVHGPGLESRSNGQAEA